ncbi:bleomycin resistance protein [Nocardia sp. NPDC051570]|uniref:bleomycin resistance protein n=1 Tax=Nocardia sp. NPDC051570 TaxID=3364324 RepID=UPI00378BF2AE
MAGVYWNPMVPELLVSSFSRSHAFYVGRLGLTAVFERGDPLFVYLSLGKAQLMLVADDPEAWVTSELSAPRGRGINLQIEVENVTVLRDRIVAAGHPLFRDMLDEWYDVDGNQEGQREYLIQDPDGYLLRFVEPLGTSGNGSA